MQKAIEMPLAVIPGFTEGRGRAFVEKLHSRGMRVLAVCAPDDDAGIECANRMGCHVLTAVDRAQAVRLGFEYFLRETPKLPGIVLVDMECGYQPEDVLAVADTMADAPDKLVIASRTRNPHHRGLGALEKSVAHLAFAAVHGRRIQDPWSGLKGIPAKQIGGFLQISGAGRQYEFNILLALQHNGIQVVNVPISTSYSRELGADRKTRLRDIISILLLPMKFISSSVAALISDYAVFSLITYLILHQKWGIATAAGRFMGALVGYLLNRSIVFRHSDVGWKKEMYSAGKYALLALVNFCLAFGIMHLLIERMSFPQVFAKMIADAILYVMSYIVQRDIVFRKKPAVES